MSDLLGFLGIMRGVTWAYLWAMLLVAGTLAIFDRGPRERARGVVPGSPRDPGEQEPSDMKRAA